MKYYFLILICILLSWQSGFAGQKSVYTIGLLSDSFSPEMEPMRKKLIDTVTAVVGQRAQIRFDERFLRPGVPDFSNVEKNYNFFVNDPETDIIMAFGPFYNYHLIQKKAFAKPVLLYGAINQDFIDLPEGQITSNINNLTYLITPESVVQDLTTFAEIYPYKNIGIVISDILIEHIPVAKVLDQIFNKKAADFTLIPISNLDSFSSDKLQNIDSVYLTAGIYLDSGDFQTLVAMINAEKLPSFSAIGKHAANSGVLMTHSSDFRTQRFMRRIALSIEDIIMGKNAKDIPVLIDTTKKLTFNIETAQLIDFPIRFSQLLTMELVGDSRNFPSDKKYSLPEVLEQLLGKNYTLQAEKKNLNLAKKDLQLAKSSYLPDLTATGQGTAIDPELAEVSSGSNPEYSTNGSITLEQVLYSESASANIAIEKNLRQATKQNYTATEMDMVLDGCAAYFNVLIAKTNFSIRDENLRLTRSNFEIASQNYAAGQTGKADVLRWKSELAQATQNLVSSRISLKQSFSALNEILGNPIDFKVDVDEVSLEQGIFKAYNYQKIHEIIDNPILRKKVVSFLVDEARSNAPELKALNYNIRAAERTSALYLRSRFLPTIALQGQYDYTFSRNGDGSNYPAGFSEPPDGYYRAGVSISLPIFQRNQLNLNRQRSMIREEQLALQKESVELALEKNVYDIVHSLVSQISNIRISRVAAEAAAESLELVKISYSNGAVSITSLIDAQQAYIQAQQQQTNAIYNYLINLLQLERIIGYFFILHTDKENQEFDQRFIQYAKKQEINTNE